MFTGIVQASGSLASMEPRGAGARVEIAAPALFVRKLQLGDSVAVNGCCLTVVSRKAGAGARFAADLAPETLARTSLGGLRPGARLNLEPALRAGDPLGGHMVQGHVEGVGKLVDMKADAKTGGSWMRVKIPAALQRYCIWKGSIAIDGVSLTIAKLERGVAGFAIVPFTLAHTNLGALEPGAAVNLETDPIARYVEKLLPGRTE